MTTTQLKSCKEADKAIANLFRGSGQCAISVREENVFKDEEWLALGTIRLAPLSGFSSSSMQEPALVTSVKLVEYDWNLPEREEVQACLQTLLGMGKNDVPDNIRRALDDIASIIVRTDLLRPLFDPAALQEMPYKTSITIVADTSGVLQGGLDFVARHLHPAARVKVPAIVHMELVNSADRFFKFRRSTKNRNFSRKSRELLEHMKSQGGQRALLHLELHSDTEVERTFLLGDPLRTAFEQERGELSELNLSVANKSYVDRLILEAARHHQAQSGPTHEVRLLTSDQGLARMALAEGIRPLYCPATKAASLFGNQLTGRTFHPFGGKLQGTSLAAVLWELATSFGSARLVNEDDQAAFTVHALGKDLPPWSPYHSLDDLLWCEFTPTSSESALDRGAEETEKSKLPLTEQIPASTRSTVSIEETTFLRFSVERLFRLICLLDDQQLMNTEGIMQHLGFRDSGGTRDYRRFLLEAGLVSIQGQKWQARPLLAKLSGALRNQRIEEIHQILLNSPSYAAFVAYIEALHIGQSFDGLILGRGMSNYPILGEVNRICGKVQGEGIFPTPTVPSASQFAPMAVKRFSELEGGEGLVATGAWLEALIKGDGVHPEIARLRLEEASQSGFLRRSTEGSTMQVGYDRHILRVLGSVSEMPSIEIVYLYRGDYLIQGKASVSLRIESAIR